MSNKKNLVIVESPSKCKTIKKILTSISSGNEEWDVKASVGHVMSLNADKNGRFGSLGINKQTLEMDYVLSQRGADIIKDLKKLIKTKKYDRIIIATDPDREGEGIAEHLRIRLELGDNYDRCTFNEITKRAVEDAINNPTKVNENLIQSQDARRILDRVVGWEGTTAASKVLGKRTPIGRVQSKVVDFIVEREQARKQFVETQYYGINCLFEDWESVLDVKASNLIKPDDSYWTDKAEAEYYASMINSLVVEEVEKSVVQESAPMPFETATMQQAAINKLGFDGKKCDKVAQKLYQAGVITYIRTDSTAISDEGFKLLQEYAKSEGLPVLSEKRVGKSGAVAQEAHECIRPSDFSYDPSSLDADERALYELIKTRCLASQLEPAVYDKTLFKLRVNLDDLKDTTKKEEYTKLPELLFKTSGRILKEQGWRVLLDGDDSEDDEDSKGGEDDDGEIPNLNKGDVVTANECKIVLGKTKMPPRFNAATLIKKLKQHGVGRPSTYSTIFEKIGEGHHGYILKEGSKKNPKLVPSDHAVDMVVKTKNYLSIMDVDFTTEMEDRLDKIANGDEDRDSFVFSFFDTLTNEIAAMIDKEGVIENKIEYHECPTCAKETLRRFERKNKQGFFWSCKNPDCKATFSDKDGEPIDKLAEFLNKDGTPKFPCPDCSEPTPLIRIKAKSKKFYWVCSKGRELCGFITSDKKDSKEPDLEAKKRREEWFEQVRQSKDADGNPLNPCPECKKALVKCESQKTEGVFYYRCESRKSDCSYSCPADSEGNPVIKD